MTTIQKEFGRYTYLDDVRGIRITMRQLKPERGYLLSAHITIEGQKGNWWKSLYTARNGISTTSARNSIERDIQKQLFGDPKKGIPGLEGVFGLTSPVITNDWSATLTEACEGIQDIYDAGTPPMDLYDSDIEDDDVWRIPGLLAEDINVIYGQASSGKSYLSIVWGQAIQNGVDVCGLRTIKGNVMLVDYETTPPKMRRRFRRVDAGLGLDNPKAMAYIPATIPIARMMEQLQNYITEHKIEFLIIDSLARAVGGKITDDEGVNAFFEALRQLERPCLIIHHTNKGDDYYGSPYIRANARSMYRLRSVRTEGKLSIQLIQEKENDGSGTNEVGFVLSFIGDPFDPDQVTLSPQDNSVIPGLRRYMELPKAIQGLLAEVEGHKMLIKDVLESDQLELSEQRKSTFNNYMWALKNKTGKYKQLADMMRVEGDYLILNSIEGGISSNGTSEIDDLNDLAEAAQMLSETVITPNPEEGSVW